MTAPHLALEITATPPPPAPTESGSPSSHATPYRLGAGLGQRKDDEHSVAGTFTTESSWADDDAFFLEALLDDARDPKKPSRGWKTVPDKRGKNGRRNDASATTTAAAVPASSGRFDALAPSTKRGGSWR